MKYMSSNFAQIAFKVILTSLLLVKSSSVYSSELTIWHSVNTYHVDRANDEANDENSKVITVFYNDWFIGSFNNSYSKRSEILGYKIWKKHWTFNKQQFETGFSIALATGYGRELWSNIDGIVTLGVSPSIGWSYRLSEDHKLGIDVLYLPTDNGGVFVSGINVTFIL